MTTMQDLNNNKKYKIQFLHQIYALYGEKNNISVTRDAGFF